MPLLWFLRDDQDLTGTKYSCGLGICGSCSVLIDGEVRRSCVTPMGSLAGKEVLTIEGLSAGKLHTVQQAWIDAEVPACGYCQPGQILNAVALLEKTPHPDDDDIDAAMSGVLCRCGTYNRIRRAIHLAAGDAS